MVSDNGNFIADCDIAIEDAEGLEKELNNIPGVVENGIFPARMVDSVIIGYENEARMLK